MNQIACKPLTPDLVEDYLRFDAALLDAACEGLRASGMSAVQAKPRKAGTDAAAKHLGPLAMYLAAGFKVVRDGDDDDVYVRRTLG